MLNSLAITLLVAAAGLSLVEPLDFSLSNNSLQYLIDMRRDDLSEVPHLNLKVFASVFTSVSLVLRKPGNTEMRVPFSKKLDTLKQHLAARRESEGLFPTQSSFSRNLSWRARSLWYRFEEWFYRNEFASRRSIPESSIGKELSGGERA